MSNLVKHLIAHIVNIFSPFPAQAPESQRNAAWGWCRMSQPAVLNAPVAASGWCWSVAIGPGWRIWKYRRPGKWNNKRKPAGSGCTYRTPTWQAGKSPYQIRDTSSNGCFCSFVSLSCWSCKMKLLKFCEGNNALEVMFHCTMNNCEDNSSHDFVEFLLVKRRGCAWLLGGWGLVSLSGCFQDHAAFWRW